MLAESVCLWVEMKSAEHSHSWLTIAYAIMPVGVVAGKVMTDGAWGDTKNQDDFFYKIRTQLTF